MVHDLSPKLEILLSKVLKAGISYVDKLKSGPPFPQHSWKDQIPLNLYMYMYLRITESYPENPITPPLRP